MASAVQLRPTATLGRVVGVAAQGRTYRRLLFLVLAFPLGLTYFVTLVTMFSLGIGLTIILVGIPILAAAVALTVAFVALERVLASLLLDVEFEESMRPDLDSFGDFVRSLLLVRRTWLGLVYLLSQFFVGTAAFVLLWCSYGIGLSLLATPFYYEGANVGLHLSETIHLSTGVGIGWGGHEVAITVPITIGSWVADSLLDALALSAVGLGILLLSLHATNFAGRILRVYAGVMLR